MDLVSNFITQAEKMRDELVMKVRYPLNGTVNSDIVVMHHNSNGVIVSVVGEDLLLVGANVLECMKY